MDLNILLLEDDDALSRRLAQLLAQAGCFVTTCATVPNFIECLEDGSTVYTVALIDLLLLKEDEVTEQELQGRRAAEYAAEHHPDVTLICISSDPDRDDDIFSSFYPKLGLFNKIRLREFMQEINPEDTGRA